MRSIQNIKTLLLFTFTISDVWQQVFEDQKFEWQESFAFIPSLSEIPSIIQSLPEIPKELADLDKAEREELIDFFQDKFDIENDAVEKLVEYSFAFLLRMYGEIQAFKEHIEDLPRKEQA